MDDRQNRKKTNLMIKLPIALSTIASLLFYTMLVRWGYVVPLHYLFKRPCLGSCQSEITSHPAPPDSLLNYDRPLPDLMGAIDKSKVSILIEKAKYRLTVYYDKSPIKSYPVVFGSDPVGDKQKEGDNRTPEGMFKIRDLYPHNRWSKFIWIDYPNEASWKKFREAKRQGRINRGDRIGGEVGIHGVPQNQDYLIDQGNNWTWGCISLKNKDVDEIYEVLQKNTWIEIVP